jgi:hypothetical protein
MIYMMIYSGGKIKDAIFSKMGANSKHIQSFVALWHNNIAHIIELAKELVESK